VSVAIAEARDEINCWAFGLEIRWTLRETIITFFEAAMVDDQIVLPYAKQGLLGDVYDNARVLSEDYDTTGRIMKVRGLPGAIARLRRALAAS
jgi:GTP-binding protein HflX